MCNIEHAVELITNLSSITKQTFFLILSECQRTRIDVMIVQFSSVQFCSVQDGIYAMGKADTRSTPSLRSFTNVTFGISPNVGLIDDGPFSSSQGRSLSASSVYASLHQATDGVMSLALYPQVVSQAPKYFIIFRDASRL